VWSAAIAVAASIFAVRVSHAQEGQGVLPKASESARTAAHQAEKAEHGGGPNPLAVDPDLAIWTLVVFLILFAVLKKFAWPQIASAIDERERKIAADIAAAAQKNEEAKRLLAEHEAKLAATAGEIRALLEEARRDAEHTRKQGEAKGQEDAKAMVERALREIERAKDGAIQELAVTSANVAIDLARKVMSEQLTPEQNNKLVRDAMAKLAATTPSKN
jgi:F-type H+-transporting ATPase subunit b